MFSIEQSPDSDRWAPRLARWSGRLQASGLRGLVGVLLEAAEPLGPLGAQVLWVAQPALGVLLPRDEIASLARLLDEPGGMAWLRGRLVGSDDETDSVHE
jgi:hypothetical protein